MRQTFPDSNGTAFGPLFVWNWMPSKPQATGYLFATVQRGGGDFGKPFDYIATGGVGLKAFVGNSAAIRVFFDSEHFEGSNVSVTQTHLGVGIVLYAFKR